MIIEMTDAHLSTRVRQPECAMHFLGEDLIELCGHPQHPVLSGAVVTGVIGWFRWPQDWEYIIGHPELVHDRVTFGNAGQSILVSFIFWVYSAGGDIRPPFPSAWLRGFQCCDLVPKLRQLLFELAVLKLRILQSLTRINKTEVKILRD